MLRKQKGFKEEITLCGPGTVDGASISLWQNKTDADGYNDSVYPDVVKILAKVIDGTPRIHPFETVISTFHKVAVAV